MWINWLAISKTALPICVMFPLILLPIGLFLYNAIQKGKALTTLTFFPRPVKDFKIEGITPVITFSIGIQNTSGQNVVMRSFAGNLYSNNTYIGNVSSFTQVTIKPNSETVLTIKARLFTVGVVSEILNAFNGNGIKKVFELDAKANIENYQLPVKIKYAVG